MAAPSDKKSVMDVSKPGKSPADATARPIITGHAMMKDPMVTDDESKPVSVEVTSGDSESPADKEAASPSSSHKIIQPLGAEPTAPEAETTDKPEQEPAEAEKPADTEEPQQEKQPSVTDDAVVDAVLEQVGDKKQENKLSEEEAKHQEMVQKLVDEKKYFLPIHHERAKKNGKLFLIILSALLPLLVGLGLAADAGIIDPGFKVPFDFIKDKTAPAVTTTTTPSTTQQTTPVSATPVMKGIADADTAKWTKVTSELKGFTVSIPDGWQVTNYQKENRMIETSGLLTYTPGTPAKVVQGLSSVADIYRFDAWQSKIADVNNIFVGDEQKQDFVSGTLKGTRYYKKYPVVATTHGPIPGSERYVYEFKTKSTVTYISYVIINYNQYTKDQVSKSDANQLALIEKLVKTLQIKE